MKTNPIITNLLKFETTTITEALANCAVAITIILKYIGSSFRYLLTTHKPI